MEEHEDGMTIHGLGSQARITLDGVHLATNNDHRMAMSQALFALRATDAGPCDIHRLMDDASVVSKSFPGFWHIFEAFADD